MVRLLQPVRPFLLWDDDNIPLNLWKKFAVGCAILKKCMSYSDLVGLTSLVENKGGNFNDQEIDHYYYIVLKYILSQVEYIKK